VNKVEPRLDSRFSFDTFVVDAGNRLAASAARRSAEAPGTYNPLVIYGPSGYGKTHLLHALGNRALEIRPELSVVYEPLEAFVDRLSAAIGAGRLEAFRNEYLRVDLLLLDDAQYLTGKVRTQEELLPIWDAMGRNGAQVVLAADRPPTDIDGLDVRLGARFARGLIVDIAPPEPETRAAILQLKLQQKGAELNEGVAPALAQLVQGGVHELEHALDRVLRWQHDTGAAVTVQQLGPLFGLEPRRPARPPEPDAFDAFITDITSALEEVVDSAPWRNIVADAILRWGGEGMRTRRLEEVLEVDTAPDVEGVLRRFEADARRLQQIASELSRLDPRAAASPLLRDPERVEEAEALLLVERLEHRPLPAPPPGVTFAALAGGEEGDAPSIAIARRIAARAGGEHNPLFVCGGAARCSRFLAAVGNAALAARRVTRAAFLSGTELATEADSAIRAGYLDLWCRRYERVELLLIDGLEPCMASEPVQEALLTLVDALGRGGGQLVVSARSAPRALARLDPRLLSRFEGGTVLDLDAAAPSANGTPAAAGAAGAPGADRWFLDREKLAWDWSAVDDRLMQELD
jgi:chromosomal replication initiation ATPase DnaA